MGNSPVELIENPFPGKVGGLIPVEITLLRVVLARVDFMDG